MAANPITLLLFCFIVLFAVFFILRRIRRPPNLPPGSTGLPLIGHTLQFIHANHTGNPDSFIENLSRKYHSPPVFRISLLGNDIAFFFGTRGNKFLFGNENNLVALWWPPAIQSLFGRCLINCTGDEAKRHRKLLYAFLSPEALVRYVALMDELTRAHFSSLWKGSKAEEVIKVYPTVKLYTFQIACRLFTSIEDPKRITKLEEEYEVFTKGMLHMPLKFPGTRYYKSMKAASVIRKYLEAAICDRRMALAEHKASASQDLLSHMLVTPDDTGMFLSEEEIVNNILTLLFAGHDTATSTITMVFKYLADFPAVYDDVLQEQMGIAESKKDGELLNWEDIQKMKISWNVVCEVMRLKPPVTGNFRVALTDFTYEGYTIPKGWKLNWNTCTTHKDPSLFPNPEKFDPGRFEGGVAPFSYTPFGGGPRMCLGKEFARLQILVFMHNLVKDFKWELLIPEELISYDPMPVPQSGLPIRIQQHRQNV